MDNDARWPLTFPARGAAPAPGLCHLWLARTDPMDPALAGLGLQLLGADELDRAAQFRAASARDTFVASRTAQRLIAGHYLGQRPQDVPISRTCRHCGAGHGRPHVPGAGVDFSVSHSAGLIVIAVTGRGCLVGADLEGAAPSRLDELADRVLSPAERKRFGDVRGEDRPAWFLRAWTRKEAVVKLTGHGLAAPFPAIDVSGPVVTAAGPLPAGWPAGTTHLLDVEAGASHLLALATTTPLAGLVRCGPLSELVANDVPPATAAGPPA